MQILDYESYETIWIKSLAEPHTKLREVSFTGAGETYVNQFEPGELIVHYSFQSYMLSYVRAPITVWSGLARIGGIMAIFKIIIIGLTLINRWRFEAAAVKVLLNIKGSNSLSFR